MLKAKKQLKVGGILFGKLKTHKKFRGPLGPLQTRKILTGKNKGRNALW